jgi:hypothetical protein
MLERVQPRFKRYLAALWAGGVAVGLMLALVGGLLVGGLLVGGLGVAPVWAAIHEYPLPGDDTMVRSLQTLRDRKERAWQLVMYKQSPSKARRGQLKAAGFVHLRLVGYPGAIAVNHPDALTMTREGATQTISDVTPDGLSQNIGEYDFTQVLQEIDSNAPVWLQVPVLGKPVRLTVPPFIIQEWRNVAEQ